MLNMLLFTDTDVVPLGLKQVWQFRNSKKYGLETNPVHTVFTSLVHSQNIIHNLGTE